MFDLDTIKQMNRKAASAKILFRARALNTCGGHPKDEEKGRRKLTPAPRPSLLD
jgi:hypothetical protein